MESSTPNPVSRLSACALGCSFGTVSALYVLVLGVLAWHFKYGVTFVTLLSSVYIGFAATPKGIAIGVLWALLDGFVFGLVVGLVYNKIVKYHRGCKQCHPELVNK